MKGAETLTTKVLLLAAASSPRAWIAGGQTGFWRRERLVRGLTRGGKKGGSRDEPRKKGVKRGRGGGDNQLTGEVVAADVVELGVLNEVPDLGALEVVEVVVVGGGEVGAEAAVVAGDDDAAAAGGVLGVDAVLDAQADLLDGVAQDAGVLVVAHAAQVHDAPGAQHVRGAARRVLRRAARDQLRVVVVQQLVVQRNVLRRRQDRVVRLEVVLLEQLFATDRLDVCKSSPPRDAFCKPDRNYF